MIVTYKRHIPLIFLSFMLLISIWFLIRGIVKLSYLFLYPIGEETILISVFIGNPASRSFFELFLATIWLTSTWLLSTKVYKFQSKTWRVVFFSVFLLGITFQYVWNASAPIYGRILPYLLDQVESMHLPYNSALELLFRDATNNLGVLLLIIPSLTVFLFYLYMGRVYNKHSEKLQEYFFEWEYPNRHLQPFFRWQHVTVWPDIELAPNSVTGEMVYQSGKDRTLNNLIIGSIGTGKTSALVIPMVNADLHHMTRYINHLPSMYKQPEYHTKDGKGRHLNGITIIEPSNDLCQKAYELTKAHGIPKEAIFYIDPTNPNTKSINPMKGPVDKVAEVFTSVVEGIGEKQDFFFQQSQRVHLKNYIYLLKLHDVNQDPTLNELMDMYNNPQVARHMHLKLKQTIPKNYKEIEDRDERNHWEIVSGIDAWFNKNLKPLRERRGPVEVDVFITDQDDPYFGEKAYYDVKEEHVQGLRNVLDDIAANKLLRRVLFGKSDFDMDVHLITGGVLLVNSAKGELSELSSVFGKMILLSLQNAVFRREPNVSTFHHIYVDEFADYIYEPFKSFPAQSRKYKTILTVATQTISQLADKYGATYMETLMGTFRSKFVYGDIPKMDAEYFSTIFGTHEVYEEGETDTSIGPLQDNTMRRLSSSFRTVEKPLFSPSELIYQEAFQCVYKLVDENTPTVPQQLIANFVPKSEFKEAVVTVDEEAAEYWLRVREEENQTTPVYLEEGIEEDDEVDEQAIVNDVPSTEDDDSSLNQIELSYMSREPHEKQPLDYNATNVERSFIEKDEEELRKLRSYSRQKRKIRPEINLYEQSSLSPLVDELMDREDLSIENERSFSGKNDAVATEEKKIDSPVALEMVMKEQVGEEKLDKTAITKKIVASPLEEDAKNLFSSLHTVLLNDENEKTPDK